MMATCSSVSLRWAPCSPSEDGVGATAADVAAAEAPVRVSRPETADKPETADNPETAESAEAGEAVKARFPIWSGPATAKAIRVRPRTRVTVTSSKATSKGACGLWMVTSTPATAENASTD